MRTQKESGAEWKQVTADDLGQALSNLNSLSASISGALSREQARTLWLAYLHVEKSVAFIKIELAEENPGRFIVLKRYVVPDERQAIGFALRHLQEANRSFESGDLLSALRGLRESRNYLRALLKRVRRHRLKNVSAD